MGIIVRNQANSIIHQSNPPRSTGTSSWVETIGQHDLGFAHTLLKRWEFDGIGITYSETDYKDRVSIEWKNALDAVQLHFNLHGKSVIELPTLDRPLTIHPQQHNVMYSNGFEGVTRNDSLQIKTFLIQFTRDTFLKITDGADDILKRFCEKVLNGESVAFCEPDQYMDMPLYHTIDEVIHCKFTGGLKKIFLLSKSIEILALQAQAIQRSQGTGESFLKTNYDKERILFARDFIVQHVDNPPNLSELSRIAGINEYKLKKGFRATFNNTVFGYLTDYRLELAKRALAEGEKTAGEIAFDLGYSSLQHFSSAFKKKFGMSPKQMRSKAWANS